MKQSVRMLAFRFLVSCVLVTGLSGHAAHAQVENRACGDPFHNNYGPFDYRATTAESRAIVEHYHFTPKVASLEGGQSTMNIGADIAYTLRVYPNHPQALMAMAELARRQKTPTPKGAGYPVKCWFERAIEFRPDDGIVRTLFGIELLKHGDTKDAIEQLKMADKLSPRDANVQYNLGLAYFDLGDYDRSLEHAKAAYGLGFPLPGLRQMLERAHKWN